VIGRALVLLTCSSAPLVTGFGVRTPQRELVATAEIANKE
jgi:hypothetical protein